MAFVVYYYSTGDVKFVMGEERKRVGYDRIEEKERADKGVGNTQRWV